VRRGCATEPCDGDGFPPTGHELRSDEAATDDREPTHGGSVIGFGATGEVRQIMNARTAHRRSRLGKEFLMTSTRSRWAAIGAAVAVTLGAGGVSLTQAALGSGDKPVFVAIEPCRLIDTRGDVGSRVTPLGAGEVVTLQVTGSNGQCSGIPADATAAALNVTAIQGSTRSYLTLFPADTDLPNASNLNWNGGDPPTPNKVDVKLSSGGAVKISNNDGTVHVAADLVGYYVDHHHDDRYYTKSQVYDRTQIDAGLAVIDGQLDQKANASTTYTKAQVDALLAQKANQSTTYTKSEIDGFLAVENAAVTSVEQVGAATVGAEATIISATVNPPADGDLIALGIATGDPDSGSYRCSLSETDDLMDDASTQSGDILGQVVPVRGISVSQGVAETIYLVCEADTTADITGASIRLIYFPD
jgi:hypothetical protein